MRALLVAGLTLFAAACELPSAPIPSNATASSGSGGASSTTSSSSTSTSTTGSGGAPAGCDPVPGSGGSSVGIGFAAAWATSFGTEEAAALGPGPIFPAADGSSRVFGSYSQSIDLGPGLTLSAAEGGAYQARVAATGEVLSLDPYEGGAVRVDDAGGLWVVRSNGPATSTVVRYDDAGNQLWSFASLPYGVVRFALAGDGIVLSEAFLGGKPFDYGSGSVPLGAGAEMDVAVLKIGPQGTVAWARSLAPAIWPSPPAVEHWIKPYDFTGGPTGGATALLQAYEYGGSSSMVVVRLDATGAVTWTRTVPGPSFNAHPRLAVDTAGNTLITVENDVGDAATVDLGCGELTGLGIALAMIGADGTPRWVRFYPGSIDLSASFDAAGNILLAGQYSIPVDLGGGMLPTPATWQGRMVVLKLSPDGAYVASKTFGDGAGNAVATMLTAAATPDGRMLLAGATTGSLDLGLSTGPLPDQGKRSLFLTLLDP